MSVLKTCPYCGGRGYINQFENIDSGCHVWEKECIACKGTGSILVPETNADRIRRMSDEELADLLADWDFCSDVCSQQYSDNPPVGKCPENCKEQALRWLRQPAEEDT